MPEQEQARWEPACDSQCLRLRAQMLATIRNFFEQRSVLEVETPILCQATGTDPQLDFFSSLYQGSGNNKARYLQTSPEFTMKRLLAAGSGSIYQICKAFRQGELGRFHNPEFTILEWYRVDFTLQQLMDEVTELVAEVLQPNCLIGSILKFSYADLFEQVTGLNPLVFSLEDYKAYALNNNLNDAISLCVGDHSLWLDFIFSYKVQPVLADHRYCIVYGYPAIQSSLARINRNNTAIADRFEVFIKGIEIGNGFFELKDVKEQEKRFDQENNYRREKGLPQVEKDQLFLQALRSGLPDCSGIAIGLDRLLMIVANVDSVSDIIAFPFDRA